MTNRRRGGKRHKPFKGKTVHRINAGPTLDQQIAQAQVRRPVFNPVHVGVKNAILAAQYSKNQ